MPLLEPPAATACMKWGGAAAIPIAAMVRVTVRTWQQLRYVEEEWLNSGCRNSGYRNSDLYPHEIIVLQKTLMPFDGAVVLLGRCGNSGE